MLFRSNISQFIFMSTMSVYGKEGKLDQDVIINLNTQVDPKNFYALSKVEAELELGKLNDSTFKVAILRPPIVYGPDCPGNYSKLEKLAVQLPVFPLIENKRSMLYIDNLCQFVKEYIDSESFGLFLPQDIDYVNTSIMVKELAKRNGKSIHLSKTVGLIVKFIGFRINVVNKIFGNLVYAKEKSK